MLNLSFLHSWVAGLAMCWVYRLPRTETMDDVIEEWHDVSPESRLEQSTHLGAWWKNTGNKNQ